jgi:hypothetical protein
MADMVMQAEKPDEIRFSLAITMSLKEWRLLRGQLQGESHPAWTIRRQIAEAVTRAETAWWRISEPETTAAKE